jgi:exonuclease 3'-5' domain-containing protein 1
MSISTRVVDSVTALSEALALLTVAPGLTPPVLYIDLEGVQLSRTGSISIVTLYDHLTRIVYLIDIHLLKSSAFTTQAMTISSNSANTTLKSILESPDISKVFFDARNDSDALFSHYGIKLQGIIDVQLMELATRPSAKDYLSSLAKCMTRDVPLSDAKRQEIQQIKEKGRKLFAPEQNGSYEVFNQRPLPPDIEQYCIQDVVHMHALWQNYHDRLYVNVWQASFWQWMVTGMTLRRIEESQSADYQPHGPHKTIGWTVTTISELWNYYNSQH